MKLITAASLLVSLNAFSQDFQSILPSNNILEQAQQHNQMEQELDAYFDKGVVVDNYYTDYTTYELETARTRVYDTSRSEALRPFAEYENPKYLMFSAKTDWGTESIKQEMLANMPADIQVIIYTERQSTVDSIKRFYTPHIGNPDRLTVIATEASGNPFWSRDTIPIPVWTGNEANKQLAVVDARYYHYYEPDAVIADYFSVPRISHNYYYEGGNFIADGFGNCMLVHKNTGERLPDSVLVGSYGCKSVTRFPFSAGIGHIDERIKLLSNQVAFTDTRSYVSTLENQGFKVKVLPRPATNMGTYINALVLNSTVFLPVFGEPTDQEAIKAYQDQGLTVVPIRANRLVQGMGSIHCITMAYPDAPNVVINQ